MAMPWSKLSADQKIAYLIENLSEKQDQQKPIACSLCDQIFFDNRSLLNHFQSHFHRDGASNQRPLVGNFVSPENGTNFFSSSSQYTNSLSMPLNVHTTANENLIARARQTFTPNPPNLLQGNYPFGTLSQNSAQFREPTSAHGPQSYPLPSILRSTIRNGTFASPPNPSSNFYSRFISQLTGPQNVRSPIRPITPGIFASHTTQRSNLPRNPGISTSQTTQPSNFRFLVNPDRSASQATQVANFHFLVNPATSSSQPIQQLSFNSPIAVGAFAARSIPGTSDLALNKTTRNLLQNATANEVEGPSTGYAKPYITQLEQPIAEMVEYHDDMDVDANPDAVDLNLKL
ncbi:hypothetical protein CDL12_20276 [Handroanthus impetiginosus]|uniref:C2H2-type domain-containing protein n=1 Tax=Handroanthus impetiginosus TaxID=429701 RepID=A0A2G9GPF9_9LAMI|nr:hypothetical protein CDL12_20276 [Handroanthus impetiginosus]